MSRIQRPKIDYTEAVAGKQAANAVRMPIWIRQELGGGALFGATAEAVKSQGLHTVCEEARCPNRGECWSRGTATFMLLGEICTRACGFCSVKTGRPNAPELDEPQRVLEAVRRLALQYVVLTSVNRDDLADGGVSIYAECLRRLRQVQPTIGIEFLTPDFHQRQPQALETIAQALVQTPAWESAQPRLVWGHNMETVPRLYRQARKGSDYRRSLDLLEQAARLKGVEAKSALMLGLGETHEEVLAVLRDLRAVGVRRLSLGQYLRPTLQHLPVQAYIHPREFDTYAAEARAMGFGWVKAGPLVRSSYHAEAEL